MCAEFVDLLIVFFKGALWLKWKYLFNDQRLLDLVKILYPSFISDMTMQASFTEVFPGSRE